MRAEVLLIFLTFFAFTMQQKLLTDENNNHTITITKQYYPRGRRTNTMRKTKMTPDKLERLLREYDAMSEAQEDQ